MTIIYSKAWVFNYFYGLWILVASCKIFHMHISTPMWTLVVYLVAYFGLILRQMIRCKEKNAMRENILLSWILKKFSRKKIQLFLLLVEQNNMKTFHEIYLDSSFFGSTFVENLAKVWKLFQVFWSFEDFKPNLLLTNYGKIGFERHQTFSQWTE